MNTEQHFNLLIESSPDAIVTYDMQWNVTYINQAFTDTFGWQADELLGNQLAFIPEGREEETAVFVGKVVDEGKLPPTKTQRLAKDGTLIDVQLSGALTKDEAGEPIGSIAILRDISVEENLEKQVEERTEALQKSQQQVSALVEQNPVAIIEWDRDFQVNVWNPSATEIFGYSEQEALGQHAAFIIPEEVRPHVDAVWQHLISQTGGEESTNENVTKDGRIILCQWFNTPLTDNNGNVTGVASFIEDITEQKQAEESLARRNQLLEILNNISSQAALTRNTTATLSHVAQALIQIFNCTSAYISTIDIPTETVTVIGESYSPDATEKELVSDLGTTYSLAEFGTDPKALQEPEGAYTHYVGDSNTPLEEQEHLQQFDAKSALGAMLYTTRQGNAVGWLEIYESRHQRHFSDDEVQTMETIANQLAIVVDNLTLHEQRDQELTELRQIELDLAKRNHVLEILNQLSRDASFSFELGPALNILVKNVAELLQTTSAYISSFNIEKGTLTILAEYYSPEANKLEQVSELGVVYDIVEEFGFTSERLANLKEYDILHLDDPNTPEEERIHMQESGTKSALQAILYHDGQPVGILDVFESRAKRDFSDEDIEFIQAIANQLAITVNNTNLFNQAKQDLQERQQAEAALGKRNRLLETLNTLSTETVALELNPVLNEVTKTITELLDGTSAYISGYDMGNGTLTILAEYFSPEANELERISDLGVVYDFAEEFGYDAEQLAHEELIVMHHVGDPNTTQEEQDHLEKYGTKSSLAIQMQHQGKPIGNVEVYESRHKRIFTDEEIETLEAITNRLSITIDNVNLFQQVTKELEERQQVEQALAKRTNLLEILNSLSDEAMFTLELGPALNDVAKRISELIGGTSAYISSYNLEEGTLTVIAEYFSPAANEKERVSDLGIVYDLKEFGFTEDRLEGNITINEHSVGDPNTPKEEQEHLEEYGAKSAITVQMRYQGKTVGDLEVYESRYKREFTDEEKEILVVIANRLSIAIDNARLYRQITRELEERRQLEQEIQGSLERRGQEIQVLTQLSQEITLAPDLTNLYTRLVHLVKDQFGYYHTQLFRYNAALDLVELIVGYGEIGEKMVSMHHSMPLNVGLIGKAAATGQTILSANIAEEPFWQKNPLLAETRGELVVPIKLGDQVLGVLDVQSDVAHGLNENDQILLEGLCGQIAVAMESADLREDMTGQLSELNRLQQFMTREGWQELQGSERLEAAGYLFDQAQVQPIEQTVFESNGRSNGHTHLQDLTVRGTPIGLIGIKDDDERPLSNEDEEFLTAVSQQVAEALEIARLLDTTQEALTEQERLSSELRTVAEVSTVAATIMERDRLLQNVVDLTQTSFALYHVHVYLLDEDDDILILIAGSDQVGRLMTLEENRIPLNANSIVARAGRTREPIIANNTAEAPDFMPHPLLPYTKSEMAIPLIVGDSLTGVLDIQANVEDRFDEQDVLIMRTLATQIAVAVQNAEQFAEQVETADKLREVERLKSEFLASMSHELRTPLNSIIGFADVLLEGLDGELNERMEQDVRLIRDSGDHLRNLIGDILDMSKIEAGKMDLRYEEIDIRQLAQDIIATANPLATGKGLQLNLSLADNLFTIHADRTRLRQILWNIMGNAIKFTQVGGVTLTIQPQENNILVSIRDTGIGIAPQNIPIVFEQFRQVDGALNREAEGTGLGMPITKKLVELHSGEIWVESVVGHGTTFWFTLPRFPTPKPGTGQLPELG